MKIFLNFLKFSYGNALGILIGLIITMLTTRMMTPTAFGISNLILIIVNIIMMVSMLGLDQSFIRQFHETSNSVRAQLVKVSSLITVTVMLLGIVIFYFLNSIFNFFQSSLVMFALIFLGAIVQLINRMAMTVIRMEGRGNVYSLSEIVNKLTILFILLVLFFFNQDSYLTLVLATLIGMSSSSLYLISKSKMFWKEILNSNLKISSDYLAESYKYSIPLMITTTVTLVFQATDRLTLGYLTSPEDLGIYSGAMKLVSLLMVTQIMFSNYWVPLSFKSYKNKEDHKLFIYIFDVMVIFVFLLGITVVLFKDVFVLVLGEEFQNSSELIPLLMFIPIFHTLSEITAAPINFLKKTHYHIIIASSVLFINFIGCFFFVSHLGILGAALSSAFSYAIFFLLRSYLGRKCIVYNFDFRRALIPLGYLILFSAISSSAIFSWYLELGVFLLGCVLIVSAYSVVFKNILLSIYNLLKK